MSLKTKWVFGLLLLVGVTAGTGTLLMRDIRREEALYHSASRAIQLKQILKEADHFLRRYDRAILSYVMLREDAEKLQIQQAQKSLADRLDLWEWWVADGESAAEDLAAVRASVQEMAFLRFQIVNMAEEGARQAAIDRTNSAFLPVSARTLGMLKAAAVKAESRNVLLNAELAAVTERSRKTFAGGVALALFLFLMLAWSLRDAMVLSVAPSAKTAPRPAAAPLPGGRTLARS